MDGSRILDLSKPASRINRLVAWLAVTYTLLIYLYVKLKCHELICAQFILDIITKQINSKNKILIILILHESY